MIYAHDWGAFSKTKRFQNALHESTELEHILSHNTDHIVVFWMETVQKNVYIPAFEWISLPVNG